MQGGQGLGRQQPPEVPAGGERTHSGISGLAHHPKTLIQFAIWRRFSKIELYAVFHF